MSDTTGVGVRARPRTDMPWDGWGDPSTERALPAEMKAVVHGIFGDSARRLPRRDAGGVEVSDSALTAAQAAALAGVVGADRVRMSAADRLVHAGGKSILDLLRARGSGPPAVPDAVVLPADHEQVARVLECCMSRRIAVVPFGGGTSVVGGVNPNRGACSAVVALDLRRLDALTELDPISRTATLGAGLSGPQAEELLAEQGFTLGHFPQSFRFATIGGFAATRSSGQASSGYGSFDDMIERLQVATPVGPMRVGRAPRSAAGPDLREVFAGSEGVLGVITSVTVHIRPIPAHKAYQAWSFPDFRTGTEAMRAVAQSDITPTVIRLSDEVETGVGQALSGGVTATSGCSAIVTVEGTVSTVEWRQRELEQLLRGAGGTELGSAPAQEWEHTRFDAPYLRDGLLDAGVLVETLETATNWVNVARVKTAVTEALTAALDAPTLVMCHISHIYPAGASLYFTVITGLGADPIERWTDAKRRACDVIVATGATITHHHAVGADHRAWLIDEIGELGVSLVRAVKNVVDPAGILNPGTLLP